MKDPAIKIITALVVAFILVLGTVAFTSKGGSSSTTSNSNQNNVTVLNGTQIITITAKGGYSPRTSTATSGMPTKLRFVTNGTFDCSSSVSIPSLNIGKQLAISGNTDIDVGVPKAGALQGTCGMGMYPFEINFN